MTLACEDANSKLVEVDVDVDDEDGVGNSLLQIWELRFGQKGKKKIQILSKRFGQDFEFEVQARF